MRPLFVRMGMSILFLALPKVYAQQSVADFLKPSTKTHAAIDNFGPDGGSKDNPAKTYTRECSQTNPTTISCRYFAEPLTSGGGKCFGPWYYIMPDLPPQGYQYQSSTFSMPARDKAGKKVDGPDWCYSDDNAPTQPAGPMVAPGCVSDTSYKGHKMYDDNAHHGFANCFVQRQDPTGPKYLYNLQGQEGGCSGKLGGDVIYSISCRPDGHVFEAVELDVTYVKAN